MAAKNLNLGEMAIAIYSKVLSINLVLSKLWAISNVWTYASTAIHHLYLRQDKRGRV